MTKGEAILKLEQLQREDDQESAHVEADGVLCELLIHLGYADVVEEYRKVPKWYA